MHPHSLTPPPRATHSPPGHLPLPAPDPPPRSDTMSMAHQRFPPPAPSTGVARDGGEKSDDDQVNEQAAAAEQHQGTEDFSPVDGPILVDGNDTAVISTPEVARRVGSGKQRPSTTSCEHSPTHDGNENIPAETGAGACAAARAATRRRLIYFPSF